MGVFGATKRADNGFSPSIGRSVSLDHAAQLLGCSRRTVYNRIRTGELVTIRLASGTQRVTIESLDGLIRREAAKVPAPVAPIVNPETPEAPDAPECRFA
jgi:excisionase family DNA binding protein